MYCRTRSRRCENARGNGIAVRVLNPFGRYGGLFSALRLARYARQDEVGHLLVQTNRDILISALAKSMAGASPKLIYMQHMQIGRVKKDIVHTWEYSRLDAWISPLQILADKVVQMTKIAPDKIHIVPFGVELDRFTAQLPDKQLARKQLNIPETAFVVGTVGRVDRLKGQDILIRACGRVHKAGFPLHLIVVGDRTEGEAAQFAEELQELTQTLGLGACAKFFPHMDEIELVYAAFDIFVLPSHSETYGMVTIEAMASELPVIATKSGGTPGIVCDGKNGLLVEPTDDEELAEALLRLIRDRTLAARLAKQARIDAINRFSHQRVCQLLEELLERLSG